MNAIFEQHEKISRKRASLYLGLLFVGFLALAFLLDFGQRVYVYSQARGQLSLFYPFRDGLLNAYFSIPFKDRKTTLLETNLPVYELKLSDRSYHQLERVRKKVAALSNNVGVNRSYVEAQFKLEDKWVDAKVKLRGLTYFHYTKTRPSIRVKFKGQHSLNGIDEMNFVDPYDKGITADSVVFEYLSRYGLLTVPNQFVILKINGEVAGLYQQFTQFGHVLLDNRRRTPGHIFDGESNTFNEKDGAYKRALPIVKKFQSCVSAVVCPSEVIEKYLDVPKFARALAMSTLLASNHAWSAQNVRIYFDPAHGRVEPVPWDFFFYKMASVSTSLDEIYQESYGLALLKDPRIRAYHDYYLWDLVQHHEDLIQASQKEFARIERALDLDTRHYDMYRDYKMHNAFHATLRHNSELLRKDYFKGVAPAEPSSTLSRARELAFNPRVPGVTVVGQSVRFQGTVVLPKTLELPFGYSAVFAPGLNLRLADGQSLIIHGDLTALGKTQLPISIAGQTSLKWGGVAVQGIESRPAQVHLAYLNVRGGAGVQTENVHYAGSISIHDAQVKIEHANFSTPTGEAALSAKYTDLQISHTRLTGAPDDGLDVDFSKVRIEKSVFSQAGGDCIDFNSSQVNIVDTQISNCRDKAISIGENSTARVENLKVDRAMIGVAVKDRSRADFKNMVIENTDVGVTSYAHKRTFGPSQAFLDDVKFVNVKSRMVSSQGSTIEVEGQSTTQK